MENARDIIKWRINCPSIQGMGEWAWFALPALQKALWEMVAMKRSTICLPSVLIKGNIKDDKIGIKSIEWSSLS